MVCFEYYIGANSQNIIRGGIDLIGVLKIFYAIPVILPLWTGKGSCDWFTASLLQFYLLFPWLYRILGKYNNTALYVIVTLLSILLLEQWSFTAHWQMSCFISRFPVFVSGIIFYNYVNKGGNPCLYILFSIMGFVYAVVHGHQFLLTALACPFLVIVLVVCVHEIMKNKLIAFVCKPIEKIGNRSLESYYGGWLTGYFSSFFFNNIIGLGIYVGQTLCGAFCLAKVNDWLKNTVNNRIEMLVYGRNKRNNT